MQLHSEGARPLVGIIGATIVLWGCGSEAPALTTTQNETTGAVTILESGIPLDPTYDVWSASVVAGHDYHDLEMGIETPTYRLSAGAQGGDSAHVEGLGIQLHSDVLGAFHAPSALALATDGVPGFNNQVNVSLGGLFYHSDGGEVSITELEAGDFEATVHTILRETPGGEPIPLVATFRGLIRAACSFTTPGNPSVENVGLDDPRCAALYEEDHSADP